MPLVAFNFKTYTIYTIFPIFYLFFDMFYTSISSS